MSRNNMRIKLIAGLSVLIILLAAAAYWVLVPDLGKINNMRAEKKQLEERLRAADQIIAREDEIRSAWESAVEEHSELAGIMPLPEQEGTVLAELDAYLAENPFTGFNLSEIRSARKVLYREGVLSLTGSVPMITESLQRLEKFPHPINYSVVSVAEDGDSFNIKISLQVYLENDGRITSPSDGSGNETAE